MELINLIYTNQLNSKEVIEKLISEHGFVVLERKNNILIEPLKEISITIENHKIEIMYADKSISEIGLLIECLSKYNHNHKVSIKAYKEKGRESISRLLTTEKYFLV